MGEYEMNFWDKVKYALTNKDNISTSTTSKVENKESIVNTSTETNKKGLDLIQLLIEIGGVDSKIATQYGTEYMKYLDSYQINTSNRVAGFFSNLLIESGRFTKMEENLKYSAKRLAQVWPSRFRAGGDNKNPTPNNQAIQCANNPQLLANIVYSNRMGNGDINSNDGWIFRGRGPIQITGRSNYTKCSIKTGLDCINHPDILSTLNGGVLSSLWYWDTANLNSWCDRDDIDGVRDIINIGRKTATIGDAHAYDQVLVLYKKIKDNYSQYIH